MCLQFWTNVSVLARVTFVVGLGQQMKRFEKNALEP